MRHRRNGRVKASDIPRGQIDYIVGNYHVGTPEEEVRKDIEQRARKAGAEPALVKACGAYAVKVHLNNRKLYVQVMSGRF